MLSKTQITLRITAYYKYYAMFIKYILLNIVKFTTIIISPKQRNSFKNKQLEKNSFKSKCKNAFPMYRLNKHL